MAAIALLQLVEQENKNVPVSSFGETHFNANDTATLPRDGDVIANMWLHAQIPRETPTTGFVRQVILSIGGSIIESFSGAALEMLQTFDTTAKTTRVRHSDSTYDTIVVPLMLPKVELIALCYAEPRVHVTTSAPCVSKKLVVEFLFVDTVIRRRMNTLEHTRQFTQKFCQTFSDVQGGVMTVCLPSVTKLRDVLVRVTSTSTQSSLLSGFEPVKWIQLSLKCRGDGGEDVETIQFDAATLISQTMYKYGSECQLYSLWFDSTPKDSCSTTTLDATNSELTLCLADGSVYKVDIFVRGVNAVKYCNGHARCVSSTPTSTATKDNASLKRTFGSMMMIGDDIWF